MKFSCSPHHLVAAFAHLRRVLPGADGSLPALAGVKITAGNGVVQLSASDLAATVNINIPATVTDFGAVLVPGRTLDQWVKAAEKDRPVDVEADDDEATFSDAEMASTIRTLPLRDFPATAFTGLGRAYPLDLEAIAAVIDAAGDGELLGSVLFHDRHIVANDTRRIHVCTLDAPHGFDRLLVPATGLAHVLKLVEGRPLMQAGDGLVSVTAPFLADQGLVQWVLRTVPRFDEYPPWARIYPEAVDRIVIVDPHALRRAVQKVQALVVAPVGLTITSEAIVADVRTDESSSRSKPVPVENHGDGPTFEAPYDPDLLAKVLSYPAGTDEVAIGMAGAGRPVMFAHTDEAERLHQRMLVPATR